MERTVGRAPGARAFAERFSNISASIVCGTSRGAELVGFGGLTLAEWDAIAATMSPSLRPARGGWNGSFERAAIEYRRAQRRAAVADVPARVESVQGAIIRTVANADRALSASEIKAATRVHQHTLYRTLGALVDARIFRAVTHPRPARHRRYTLAGVVGPDQLDALIAAFEAGCLGVQREAVAS